MTTTDEHLRDRYGRGGADRRRRVVIAVSGVIGVVGLAWVVWAAWLQGTPEVQSSLRSFHTVDDHTVTADVAVKAHSPSVRASCQVRAYGTDHSVVGELNFRVTGVHGTETQRVTFRTERPSTAVELIGCTAPGQKQAR